MDPSEQEEDLDNAALQVLQFLGEVHVNVAGFLAVEEYMCEQYAASIQFVRRCTSGSSNSDLLSRDNLASRKSPASSNSRRSARKAEKDAARHNSRFARQHQSDYKTICEVTSYDRKRLEEIKSLWESIDLVLTKAKHVRENFKRGSASKAGRTYVKPESPGSSVSLPVKPTKDNCAAAPKTSSSNLIASAKAGERPRTMVRNSRKFPGKSSKSQKSHPRAPEASNHLDNGGGRPGLEHVSNKEYYCPATDSGPAEVRTLDPFYKPSCKEQWKKSQLQFPEQLQRLLAWFTARGISLNDPMISQRTDPHGAEEKFLSVLNAGNQQHNPEDREWRGAAALIQKLQKAVKELTSYFSPFEMNRLLRVAPTGSAIAKLRDVGIQKLLMFEKGDTLLCCGKYQISNSPNLVPIHEQPKTLSWLPQRCWTYFGRAVESLQKNGCKEILQALECSIIHYTEPKHIVVITRLWHLIHVTLLQCYLEEFVAAPLLPKAPSDICKPTKLYLYRYRFAHSILCKEGRGLMVIAEWTTTNN